MKCLGLMSGTSVDGIDVAIVEITGSSHTIRHDLLSFHRVPYHTSIRKRILLQSSVADICHLNVLIGEVFAQAALAAIGRIGLKTSDIKLIGSHGQTLCHRPKPVREAGIHPIRSSLQLGEPAVIAERTGITTIANFRARDLAAGGEGAPLTPYVHHITFRSPDRSRFIVNLGGISNVTYLPAGRSLNDIQAFDVGPCNMLLDGLIAHLTDGRHIMDRGGRLAQKGIVDEGLLKCLRMHPFLRKKPPKTTGREEFGQEYVIKLLQAAKKTNLSLENLLATCCQFIAGSIAESCRWLNGPVEEVIIGGGGIHNKAMMASLAAAFHPTVVCPMDTVGMDSKAFEALAFAVLAYQTLHGVPANLPGVTGAEHPVILGTIVPGNQSSMKFSLRAC